MVWLFKSSWTSLIDDIRPNDIFTVALAYRLAFVQSVLEKKQGVPENILTKSEYI